MTSAGIPKTAIMAFTAMIFFLCAPSESQAGSPFFGSAPGRLRILDYDNGSASRLLFLDIDREAGKVLKEKPAWQSNDSSAIDNPSKLASEAAGAFDIVITGSTDFIRELEKIGAIRRRAPLFRSELILIGPHGDPRAGAGMKASEVMREIFANGKIFFSSMSDAWLAEQEKFLWTEAGVADPGANLNYVESGRDALSMLLQVEDEGAYTITAACEYAQYLTTTRTDAPNAKIAGTGIYRRYYICVIDHKGFREERTANADTFADWLIGEDGTRLINGFSLAGLKPFERER